MTSMAPCEIVWGWWIIPCKYVYKNTRINKDDLAFVYSVPPSILDNLHQSLQTTRHWLMLEIGCQLLLFNLTYQGFHWMVDRYNPPRPWNYMMLSEIWIIKQFNINEKYLNHDAALPWICFRLLSDKPFHHYYNHHYHIYKLLTMKYINISLFVACNIICPPANQ